MPKYKINDVLYDTIPSINCLLGVIVSLKEDSYVVHLYDNHNAARSSKTKVTLSFEYVDTDRQIRLATKAEKVLYANF